MFTFQSKVRYSETDTAGRLNLDEIINYFQDCSAFQSESIGRGVAYLKENAKVWVMTAWQIVIKDYPHFCEDIRIGTFPYEFKSFMGYRNFFIENMQGEKMVIANSIWTLVDLHTMHPVKPEPEMVEGYGLEERLDMEYAPRKIKLPASVIREEEFIVRKHHIDSNNHVNNGQYISMAVDYIPADYEVKQMRTEYKKQAVLGDVIIPLVGTVDDAIVIQLCDKDEKPYAVIEVKE